jgi:uncharacterized protein YkwD
MSVPNGKSTRLRGIVAAALACLLVLGLAGGSAAVGEERRVGPRRHMVALTNSDRARHDRHALRFNGRLSRYAKAHSQAMADAGYLFHSTGDQLLAALDGYNWQLGGENIGVGTTLEGLEQAFMASAPHRQNLLRRIYQRAAVGIVREDGRTWITVIFYG